jgi:hypothetical protein
MSARKGQWRKTLIGPHAPKHPRYSRRALASPLEVVKARRAQHRVAHGVLNVLVPEALRTLTATWNGFAKDGKAILHERNTGGDCAVALTSMPVDDGALGPNVS